MSLKMLEQEENNKLLRNIYHWYRILSIWTIPTLFFAMYFALEITFAKVHLYEDQNNT